MNRAFVPTERNAGSLQTIQETRDLVEDPSSIQTFLPLSSAHHTSDCRARSADTFSVSTRIDSPFPNKSDNVWTLDTSPLLPSLFSGSSLLAILGGGTAAKLN